LSHLSIKVFSTPILLETLEPPIIAAKGLDFQSHFLMCNSFFQLNSQLPEGLGVVVTPDQNMSAVRHAKSVVTYTSAFAANCLANSGSFFFSSLQDGMDIF